MYVQHKFGEMIKEIFFFWYDHMDGTHLRFANFLVDLDEKLPTLLIMKILRNEM